MTNESRALFYVARGLAGMVVGGLLTYLLLTVFGITKVMIAGLVFMIIYGVYMLYKIELERLRSLDKLNGVK